MIDWKWPEYSIPTYIKSHIHEEEMDREKHEYPLVPTFRLPTLIHSRSGNAKWLYEISNRNPIWMHTSDAEKLGVQTGDLLRVNTEIGYFVDKVWVTEGMKPGVVACSHHLGRWRRPQDVPGNRWATNTVAISKTTARAAGSMRTMEHIPLQKQRPRQRPHLLERRRRTPEHHLPGPPRPDQRHALLAPESAPGKSPPGGYLRRYLRGYQQVLRGV
jgi:predicted molibdopterin-dependent oxidoreductase YjgC